MPTFFMRNHGWSIGHVAKTYGVVILLSSVLGPFIAGWFADRLYARGRVDSSVRLSALTLLAMSGCAVVMPLVNSAMLTLCFVALYTVLMSFLVGLPLASIQMITPNQLRGQVSAVFLFVVNMVGIGLGATSVGLLTDHVFGYERAVGLSLAIVPTFALLTGAVALALCCAPFRKSHFLAQGWSKP
jgi:MFS family permease